MPIIIELAQGLLRRFAPWIVIAALVLAMAIAGPAACRKLHTDQARARLGEEQARAASKCGEDAVAGHFFPNLKMERIWRASPPAIPQQRAAPPITSRRRPLQARSGNCISRYRRSVFFLHSC